jgi:hypothetical protein
MTATTLWVCRIGKVSSRGKIQRRSDRIAVIGTLIFGHKMHLSGGSNDAKGSRGMDALETVFPADVVQGL